MSDAQTEARALWLAATREEICNDGDAISVIATALAAKDAELAAERAALRLAADRADRAEAQLAEALHLLGRYRTETPLGNQPHMIAAKVDDFARRAREQGGKNG